MAQILRPPGFGLPNFKPTLLERDAERRNRKSAQERRPGNDPEYLALIRQLPCCVTLAMPPNDPHHLLGGPAAGERAFGRRSTDRWAVPICRVMHDLVQPLGGRGETKWFREHGVAEVHELANALYHATRDLDIMTNIVRTHWRMP